MMRKPVLGQTVYVTDVWPHNNGMRYTSVPAIVTKISRVGNVTGIRGGEENAAQYELHLTVLSPQYSSGSYRMRFVKYTEFRAGTANAAGKWSYTFEEEVYEK